MPRDDTRIISVRGRGRGATLMRALRATIDETQHDILLDVRLTRDRRWVVPEETEREDVQLARIHARAASVLGGDAMLLELPVALVAHAGRTLYLDVRDVGECAALLAHVARMGLREVVFVAWSDAVLHDLHRRDPHASIARAYALFTSQPEVHLRMPRAGVVLQYDPGQTYRKGVAIRHAVVPQPPALPLAAALLPDICCTRSVIARFHKMGARVIAYPVNNRVALGVLRRQGVDGVLTERL